MLKGWNSTVRTTTAIRRAWMMTLIVSQRPPSSFFTPVPTYLLVLSLTSIDLCFWNGTADPSSCRDRRERIALRPECKPLPTARRRPCSNLRRACRNAAPASDRKRLDDHEGLSHGRIVREGYMDHGPVALRRHGLQALQRPAGQAHGRPAAGQVDHLHVAPEHAPAQAGPERLGAGLLGGEAPGIGWRPGRPGGRSAPARPRCRCGG